MKFDINQIEWLLIIIWIIQTIFYLGIIGFTNAFNFTFKKVFYISVVTCLIVSFTIQFGGFYKSIQSATCGTEKFNPIGIIGMYGSIGSLIIYIIFSILKKATNEIRKETRR
ncbi:MAG: hypothetical protein IPL31_01365 [Saprospiraceae bacterium]|nr:hypothetical protein [Saprospiraceae bacterium]